MPPGENKDACIAVGIGGCAFAANVDENGTGFLLGFEALGRPCRITADGELSLLRMALDTIVYAVERHAMERERARLQTRLQQAHRMETVGNLTSGIAHNFNNILGGILGHSEVIEQHLGPDTGPLRNLDAIRRGAERARDLVDQILTFGRHRDARRTPLRASALLAEAGSLLNVSLPSGIDLVIHEPPPAAIISGEPAQLQQVILNLCNNAAHAMEDGGRIEVDTDVHDIAAARSLSHDEIQPGRYVCIAVTDTGCGMDETTLTRIFEAFFTTRSSGNGLGLATVREIVREHGGAINVASTPGGGSRFEVWLPRAAADAAMPEANGSMFPLGRGDTVLMAASDGRRLLRDEEMLAALGYEPVGFSDPEAALAALRARPHRFDALIVGYLGSVTSSLGFAAALHAVAPSLPIVLATKAIEKIGTASLMSAGITDVVHWPIIAAEIAATLHHCLAPARLDTTAPHSSERGVPSLVP
jgi:signal transduction histidine kinase